ncbi:nicotinamide riboside transporter PnuC [Dysgonomonas macrotermitis]|uniref:Nicotinamide riboside transporter PnuC n=1 Tax=Dysgonomonas macrotermitis TaxID=1346286 RepID=A0A1M5AFC6_9BACT|nr:nicotinamide riboside transporter PnuC [Dysgonomonas macrotermitis]SHF28991.1 nicotinamide mononucleotide transporter [Dysgonomonas macrotermitis]
MIIEFFEQNWIEITGAIIGLLYLYFEYKADIWMWPTGIAMSSFYTYVYVKATFYAFACINIYFIIAGIYGWIKWQKAAKNGSQMEINLRNTPTRLYIPLVIASIITFAIIAYILNTFTDSHVVYGDTFVTTLSITAIWMLAQRYVEQWLLLIVVNVVSVILYFTQDLYPTSIMYLVYSIVSVFGYLRWRNLIKI